MEPISIKTEEEIQKMRVAGRLAAEVLDMIEPHVVAGVTTEELDKICHDYIVNVQDAIPAPLNYNGFPKSICTSINQVICHGIPADKKLKNGDIVNIDVTVIKDGWYGDTSRMFVVGKVSGRAQKLIDVTKQCMEIGIRMVAPGIKLGDIGYAIAEHAHKHGFSVVREYCGHGIGNTFHEAPQVLHYGMKGTGVTLKKGMTFTIEPMINLGKRHSRLLNDGWTVVTKDRSLSAQWEHTMVVTETGVEVLTVSDKYQFDY
ncbi:MAG TPA: type I methionyl aminopeptidase [Gammaproteobacteria bacterium]|nr:type I methionyl aminopeptidase [Xanthomonadales bacterium]MCB1593915.1 type I methionyl aminopeptidase [Xanthomonadales bacterium]HOP22274.1 type I methionyl aminopeptidase [Gammaproteobacteria bacterium]HPI96097.1 type I methionyl aminopeptidase [Gammaproteobacteria bacterium]HPQ87858.1 type I methionyl aminopeptidase [Gammaproteobacteria bacterium]